MAARKSKAKTPSPKKPKAKGKAATRAARKGPPKGYTSAAWERAYLMSLELDVLAQDLGLDEPESAGEGFDVADAARELARLAANHDRAANPDGRTTEQETEDWIAVGGLGADLGNMADEGPDGRVADAVRTIAHEVCYLACDYLF